MNGKGDSPRPLSVDRKTFENNWDKIFTNNKEENKKVVDELTQLSQELGLYDASQ